jgi:hypothetical protein
MTLRIFRDSVLPARISVTGTNGVMPYVNGDYAWPLAEQDRFTEAGIQLAHIDVNGTAWRQAKILDVERYDATVETAPDWIEQRDRFRGDATIYIAKSNIDSLFKACAGCSYWVIVADWTGSPHEIEMPWPDGVKFAGTQYATVPNQFDVTAIYADDWQPVR